MKTALVGIGTAFVGSACCIGPAAMTLIGTGALGTAAVKLEPYRPWFIGMTVVLVGFAFYSAYRPQATQDRCEGGGCALPSRRMARFLAWTAAIASTTLIAFPYYVGTLPVSAVAKSQSEKPATQVCTLKVSGMTCAGCEAAVHMAARSVDGVTEAKASYAKGHAEVTYDPSKTTPAAIAKAITDKSGFKATEDTQ
jgi:mercuric ion transport protein